MDPITIAGMVGIGAATALYAAGQWYYGREKRDMNKADLAVLAAENNLNLSDDKNRFVKNTMKAHQIRPDFPFHVDNIFQIDLENTEGYIFDYNYPKTQYSIELTQYRHVILVDFGKPVFPRFKISQRPLFAEVFTSADLAKQKKDKRPDWFNEDSELFTKRKQVDKVVAFLNEKPGLESLIANPNVEEIFFSGQFAGIFYVGSVKPRDKDMRKLEGDAALLVQACAGKDKSKLAKGEDKGASEIKRLKDEENDSTD